MNLWNFTLNNTLLQSEILPVLEEGKNVFVAAHGNSLRSVVMSIEGLSKEEV